MVPDRHESQRIPSRSHCQIVDKKEEVSIVLGAEAIVYPWAVMVHREDTFITHRAMTCPRGLDLITSITPPTPDFLKIFCCLMPILHYSFDLT